MSKGITKEKITEEAENLIAVSGLSGFSLHLLAEKLGIRTASLYAHVSGIDEVLAAASMDILTRFHDRQMQAIRGKTRAEALEALAAAERDYARGNASFYELIMNLQLSGNQELKDAAACIVEPVMTVLAGYALDDAQKTDIQRTFRALVYGFVSQEAHGYFSHFPGNIDESFTFAIKMMAQGIEAAEHAD